MKKASSIVLATSLAAFACSSGRMNGVDGGNTDTSSPGTADADGRESGGTPDAALDGDAVSDRPDVPRQRLCDGDRHLQLWLLVEAGGLQGAGSLVRIENGSPLLTIDGACSYWVGAGWSEDALRPNRPFRTGKLSEEDVKAIEESVPLDDVAGLADCVPNANIPDGSTLVIRTAAATATCGGITTASYPGTRFAAAWTTVRTVATKLWESGTPLDGAIHVSALAVSALGWAPPYVWPIATPLSTFVPAGSDQYRRGVSGLVDDPDSARKLRALRDQYLADKPQQPGLYGIAPHATDESGVAFLVYMRDAIPYEDAQGLLTF